MIECQFFFDRVKGLQNSCEIRSCILLDGVCALSPTWERSLDLNPKTSSIGSTYETYSRAF
ncbi:hypothetical protein DPMN_122572 [Dreissena polymorpha]|uniref:Uncharacterized protein n=1 Tax=Dreissena polymorpha TaxID=45954 RepID=A0A9D4GPY1_DREPO|nr:hypothetical protein DPMN_122445 [Dreissena polymorpha]KAH3820823.1 hypothetical protein DPMN_122572 [Dreissena polymorpha]